MYNSEAAGAEVVAFVQVFEPLEAIDKVLVCGAAVFGVEEVDDADGEEAVGDDEVCDAEVVGLAVGADDVGDVVGGFDADIAGVDVGVDEVDFEHGAEEVDDDGVVEHAVEC